jgi:hypothetical protein
MTSERPTRALSALFAVAMLSSCDDGTGAHAAGERFLRALGAGDETGAYAQLSSRRRAALSARAFGELTDHPAFRQRQSFEVHRAESYGGGRCSLGALTVDGAEWAVQLFYIEEGDAWRVHSFALQPPAPSQLGTLLEECGYWEGTRVGYSGPAIERSTTPTDS